jgi:hypothetical protein
MFSCSMYMQCIKSNASSTAQPVPQRQCNRMKVDPSFQTKTLRSPPIASWWAKAKTSLGHD